MNPIKSIYEYRGCGLNFEDSLPLSSEFSVTNHPVESNKKQVVYGPYQLPVCNWIIT